ncbi:MAG: SDR family oxidoreductase [Cytophagales bacterium]|nr:SDR family oxidoreductase [Cytophagales bacterium]MDW8385192.1 SDR family oxidoreductase [Flammeovirgaceae bacterium]
MFRLDNKIAVITGGGSGIGKEIAKLFAKQGATSVILEISEQAALTSKQEIEKEGGKVAVFPCDVSKHAEVKEVFENIFQRFGKLNILVNNAGVSHIGTIETTTEADLDRIYNINIKGVYNCLQAGVEKMKLSGGGVILNMASIASSVGLPDRFAYSMSKGAVLMMTFSVARDMLKYNIRCNCISPARVHTPFVDNFIAKNYPGREAEIFEKLSHSQPIGRMAQPEEIAFLALYLCSDEASFVTGSDYPIDGGFIKLNT